MTREPVFQNIFDAFAASAKTHRDRTAVVYLGTSFSYGKVLHFAENFAAALQDHGVSEGEKIILYIPNSVQWIVAWLGIQRAGAVAVPITPIYTAYDLDYIAKDSGAGYIVCSDTNYGYVKQAFPETRLKKVIVTRLTDLLPWWKRLFGWAFDRVPTGKVSRDEDTIQFGKILKSRRTSQLPSLKRDEKEVAEILYTGGTTKFPKGVPISHGLYLESAIEQITMSDSLFPASENVIICSAPLFHIL
ncbi:MAG: acyl--CoA ligase, partial [Deltaproteobacteria bacterium]